MSNSIKEVQAIAFYGMQKTTLLDYPGEVATTLFTAGCNLRCGFCHNPELVSGYETLQPYTWDDVFTHLDKRKNLLGGVCITGGEPLLHEELPLVIDEIHKLGLKVKLDTNGLFPERLKRLPLDYVAMDVKTSFDRYDQLGYKGDMPRLIKLLKSSIKWIIESGVTHEFRTTVVPGLVDESDVAFIVQQIKGAKRYVLSQYRPVNTLDPLWQDIEPYAMELLNNMKQTAMDAGLNCNIRANFKT